MAQSIISWDIGLIENQRRFSFNFSLVFTDRGEKEYSKQHYSPLPFRVPQPYGVFCNDKNRSREESEIHTNLSLCVTQRYSGSARKTARLNQEKTQKGVNDRILLSSCPAHAYATPGRSVKSILIPQKENTPLTTSPIPCGIAKHSLLPAVSRSLTRCSATQNIEEAARSDGGVKEISTTEETHQGINTPPLLIADKIGGVPAGRGGMKRR